MRRSRQASMAVVLFFCGAQIAAASVHYPSEAGVVNVKTQYGAKGDGITDDTAALLQAIREGRTVQQRVLYFPSGTYLVSSTLDWKDQSGIWRARLTFQGEDERTTFIRLRDRTLEFQNPAAPVPVIRTGSIQPWDLVTGSGYNGFRNYIFDLTVDVGIGNAGAVGIDYLGNNICGMNNVTIQSSDPLMMGVAGLMMKRPYGGPCLYKKLTIKGFDRGIVVDKPEYSHTFVHLALLNQRIAGIVNTSNVLSIRDLTSSNTGPAIQNDNPTGLITLIDSNLVNPGNGPSAIINKGGLFLRNITVQGYQSSVSSATGTVIVGNIAEFSTSKLASLGGSQAVRSLALPIQESPANAVDDLSRWLSATSKGAIGDKRTDCTQAIQAALDADADVVYLSSGQYVVSDTLHLRGKTKRLVGFGAVIMPTGPLFANPLNPRPVLSFEPAVADLTIEGIQFGWYFETTRYPGAVWIEHRSPRTLVLTHVDFQGTAVASYVGNENATGSLFLEDVVGSRLEFRGPQKVWAQHLNVEGTTGGDKIVNSGATLWILGLKTEKLGTIIRTLGNGVTELLGGLLYPVVAVDPGVSAFIIDEARASLTYAVTAYSATAAYQIQVTEIANGVSRMLLTTDVPKRGFGSIVSLYSSAPPADKMPPAKPRNINLQ